ncbi:MAG: 23S rRNA (uracil(1939)-C(5))-methyltransferase RlmD [Solobacterium sp.]|nr:23S rRNA (uracil(1939)-C(5))-methyltransferase RlmD [Solobacterium sp.]
MKKNDTFIATCLGYNVDGLGVVRIDDFVVFVKGLLKGEEAEIGITALKKNYAYGRVVKILKASNHRVEAKCAIHKQCGGCQLQIMDQKEQASFKEEKVKDCFRQNAKMDITPLPILCSEHIYHYRNKVQVPVQYKNGETLMGFYREHTNEIIPYTSCVVQSELSNAITLKAKEFFIHHHSSKDVRHVLVKHAHRSGQVMICLILRKFPISWQEAFMDEMVNAFPMIKSITAIHNKREDNIILDGEEKLIYGKPYIEEELLGKIFLIHAKSFFQINPYSTELLYQKAIEYAMLEGNEVLIDLYCGTGTIGLLAASKAKKVYGIEIVEDAIKDAKRNAERNGITNIEFINADAQKGAAMLLRSKIKADVVIVDPPRKGCSKDTLDAIVKIAPKRLVYVSCDPATLARDIKYLEGKYDVEEIQPVDMFPQTTHVETIVLLQRRTA